MDAAASATTAIVRRRVPCLRSRPACRSCRWRRLLRSASVRRLRRRPPRSLLLLATTQMPRRLHGRHERRTRLRLSSRRRSGASPSSARLAKVPSAAGLMLQRVPSASAAVAAAQAARKAADAAAQARDEAAKATRNAVDKILARNPSAPQITKIPSWDEPQQPVREAFEAKEEQPPRPRRDPVAANEALRAAMAAGRPDEVRAAAAAAQKIIDSFKRSQKRRRAVAAGEQWPRLYDPAPAQPYLQPQPTPVQRRTLNRRMSPRGVVQAQPTPRMGPPRSARVRVEQDHAAPSRVSELKRYYEPVPLA